MTTVANQPTKVKYLIDSAVYFQQISQIFTFPFNFELRGSMSLVFIEHVCSFWIKFSYLALSLIFPNFAQRILSLKTPTNHIVNQFNTFLSCTFERVLNSYENLIHLLIKLKQTKRLIKSHNKSCGFTMKLLLSKSEIQKFVEEAKRCGKNFKGPFIY